MAKRSYRDDPEFRNHQERVVMLNRVWFWLLVVGLVYGFAKGAYHSAARMATGVASSAPDEAPSELANGETGVTQIGLTEMGKRINEEALAAARLSVEICIGLIGIMALWLGLLS
ncbi:MAG: hypothetical protein AAF961_04855, partial [Planctomycetota bacterium]